MLRRDKASVLPPLNVGIIGNQQWSSLKRAPSCHRNGSPSGPGQLEIKHENGGRPEKVSSAGYIKRRRQVTQDGPSYHPSTPSFPRDHKY